MAKYNIPQFFFEKYPNFIKFLDVYYGTLTGDDNKSYDSIVRNAILNSTTFAESSKLDSVVEEFVNHIPRKAISDKDIFVRNITDMFSSKGTKNSFLILFNYLFGKQVDIHFPREQLFTLSDSKLIVRNSVYTADTTLSEEFLGLEVSGTVSKATAIIDDISLTDNGKLYRVDLSNINGKFSVDDSLYIKTKDKTVSLRQVISGIKILYGGTKYEVGDKFSFEGITIASVSEVGRGDLKEIYIKNGGSGYKKGDDVTITSADGEGWGAIVKVKTVNRSGAITDIDIINPGKFYTKIPLVTVVSENGTGAELIVDTNDIGAVKAFNIINPLSNASGEYKMPTFTHDHTGGRQIFRFPVSHYFRDRLEDDSGKDTLTTDIYGKTTKYKDLSVQNHPGWRGTGQSTGGQSFDKRSQSAPTRFEIIKNVLFVQNDGYETLNSHLSTTSKLQDNNYYQEFSYELLSQEQFKDYVSITERLLHPVGFTQFYNLVISPDDSIDTQVKATTPTDSSKIFRKV